MHKPESQSQMSQPNSSPSERGINISLQSRFFAWNFTLTLLWPVDMPTTPISPVSSLLKLSRLFDIGWESVKDRTTFSQRFTYANLISSKFLMLYAVIWPCLGNYHRKHADNYTCWNKHNSNAGSIETFWHLIKTCMMLTQSHRNKNFGSQVRWNEWHEAVMSHNITSREPFRNVSLLYRVLSSFVGCRWRFWFVLGVCTFQWLRRRRELRVSVVGRNERKVINL